MAACSPCSRTFLPVYEVAGTGIDEGQARRLAEALGIPAEKMVLRDGEASFTDVASYLAVPMVQVGEPEVVAGCRRVTENHQPEIPIDVKGIDYAALSDLRAPSLEDALRTTADALESAGLIPEHATPVAGHTTFTTASAREEPTESTTVNLDTHVSYRFTLDGYLLAGPGAQIQLSYGPDGNVTRVLHASRALKKGPAVEVIPADEVQSRFAGCMPGETTVSVRLVYWAPPLRPGLSASPRWRPGTIIPWYAVTVSRPIVNPRTRTEQTITSRVHLVPATNDPRYVPSVSLAAAAPAGTTVEANATATGGTPPYTFLWAGSNPGASAAMGDSVAYVPQTRDYRDVLAAQTMERTENVSVTVIDANGVRVQAGDSVYVTAQPAPESHNSITYGCESPNDPGPSPGDGSYSPERIAWQQGMAQPGGGSQRFCWLEDNSWPGDYIEPTPPGSLQPSPWINGDADFSNWGINTTNIMLYNGDGYPWGFSEMYPGATPADYNHAGGAGLSAPGSGDVQIGSQHYSVSYDGAWGSPHKGDSLQWLAMYACQILDDDASNPPPWQRWGPAFNGLHSMLGFASNASDNGVGFMTDFPAAILGANLLVFVIPPVSIVQGWLSTAMSNNMGTPAAMGPIVNVTQDGKRIGVCDFADYYWGRGPVGPTIPQSQIDAWWYIQGSGAYQEYP